MRTTVVLLALVAIACSRAPRLVERAADDPRSLVIRNVRVFDAPQGALLDGTRDVLVRDGRIAAIATPGVAADGLRELDGRGGTLLPGLVDVHAHVGASANPPGRFVLPDLDANLAAYLSRDGTVRLELP